MRVNSKLPIKTRIIGFLIGKDPVSTKEIKNGLLAEYPDEKRQLSHSKVEDHLLSCKANGLVDEHISLEDNGISIKYSITKDGIEMYNKYIKREVAN